MNNELLLENALDFLTHKIVPAWHVLTTLDGHSELERKLILSVPAAVSLLPYVDLQIDLRAEIDYYWDDKNWLGRFRYSGGEVKFWSAICQEEGQSRELSAQWQYTATKISSINGLEQHDPGHLWFWSECFSSFTKACQVPIAGRHGHLVLTSFDQEIKFQTRVLNGEANYLAE